MISVTNGRTSNERRSFAGSAIMMDDVVRMMLSLGVPVEAAARMAATNPARLLSLDHLGAIEERNRANLMALDNEGNVKLTLIGGPAAFVSGAMAQLYFREGNSDLAAGQIVVVMYG
jgi:N-acetylglucosamine-6-phosphate deacetylase